MISQRTLYRAAKLLGGAARASRVVLFGSYARGNADDDSDADFVVIEKQLNNKFSEMVRLRQVLRPLRIPVDVLVYSESEVGDPDSMMGTPLYWALKEGKTLYESP